MAKLGIVDKHAEALKPDESGMWVPPESAVDALARASVAIVSEGSPAPSALPSSGISSEQSGESVTMPLSYRS